MARWSRRISPSLMNLEYGVFFMFNKGLIMPVIVESPGAMLRAIRRRGRWKIQCNLD